MEEVEELEDNEFAISLIGIFNFDKSKTSIKINEDGTANLTLNFALAETKGILQIGPGVITVGKCGIFVKDDVNSFKDSSATSKLSLGTDGLIISLLSDRNDIELVTTAKKGRQGGQLRADANSVSTT